MNLLVVYVTFISLCFVSPFNVDRNDKDLVDKEGYVTNCADINASDYSERFCTCSNVWTGLTLMSKENNRHTCGTPTSVGCEIYFSRYRHPHLIKERSGSVKIWSSLDEGCRLLTDVQIWNTKDAFGKWESFPMFIGKYFSLIHHRWAYNIKYSMLDMNIWLGHVIKLVFQCDKCAIMKVVGNSSYPFKREVFIKDTKLMKVQRQENDIIEKTGPILSCDTIKARESPEGFCICSNPFRGYTFMSKENKTAQCMKPEHLGCNIYFHLFGHPYMITKSKGGARIWGKLGQGCNYVKELQFWNGDNTTLGKWESLSTGVYRYFKLAGLDFTKLYYANLDMNLWSGHIIKVVFGCGECAVMKVAGIKKYPFEENFIKKITWTTPKPPTTSKTTETTKITTSPSTRQSTKRITTKKLAPGNLLKVYSEEKDITVIKKSSIATCEAIKGSTYLKGHCICDCVSQGYTVMSKENEDFKCTIPREVGCDVYFNQYGHPYFIKNRSGSVKFYGNLKSDCISIKDIYLWNVDNDLGKWELITEFASNSFNVTGSNSFGIAFSNIDKSLWGGHVIKFVFKCGRCAIMKVAGRIVYPFRNEEFLRNITRTSLNLYRKENDSIEKSGSITDFYNHLPLISNSDVNTP